MKTNSNSGGDIALVLDSGPDALVLTRPLSEAKENSQVTVVTPGKELGTLVIRGVAGCLIEVLKSSIAIPIGSLVICSVHEDYLIDKCYRGFYDREIKSVIELYNLKLESNGENKT